MKFEDILEDLKKKIYSPIYLLMGEEPYFIDVISDYILDNVLEAGEREMNLTTIYGKDSTGRAVDNIARKYPMMANYQVVVVKEAQELKGIEDLSFYAQSPLKSTLLVLCYKYKKLAATSKLFKAIDKSGVVFESKKLYDNQIPAWLTGYMKTRNFTVTLDAAAMLTEFLGNDLNKIANELNKLIIILPAKSQITPEIIEKNIGISKDYNNFELQKALGNREILKVNKIVNYFDKNPKDNPITVTLVILYGFFTKVLCYHQLKDKSNKNAASELKVNIYFLKDYVTAANNYNMQKLMQIISLIREFDARSKGVGNVSSTQGDLLKELMFKILH